MKLKKGLVPGFYYFYQVVPYRIAPPMKKVRIPFIFLLFPLLVLGQIPLGYNLQKDDVFLIKQEAQQVIVQELDGATHEVKNEINGILEFKVLGETDGNYDIAMSFKDLNLKIVSSIQGELMNVSAGEIKEGDLQSKIFGCLLDYPVRMTLAKNGHILKVVGGDSLVHKMAEASGLEDEFSLNMMKKSLEKEFGSKALSDSYEQMTFIYPSEEVHIGDTWENTFSGKLSTKNEWTLEGYKNQTARIVGSAELVMDIKEPTSTMKLQGTQETEISTDLKTGFINLMKVNGLAKGKSTIPQMGLGEIPTTITSTIVYQRITNTYVQQEY
ncbi:MAG: DUF6263 family protein [Bacteroidota bacterium]